jgi:hypothetical protein
MSEGKETISVEQAIEYLLGEVFALQEQMASHTAVFMLLKGVLLEKQVINTEEFRQTVNTLLDVPEALGQTPRGAEYFRNLLEALLQPDDIGDRIVTIIKGSKDD